MALRVTLRHLEYLVAVGEAGSIAAAARRVNVSSPSISAAIAGIEADYGFQIFVRRHAHGLSPTPGGARFLAGAAEVLARAQALDGLAADISGRVAGPLQVGCLVSVAQFLLPGLRRRFVARWPDVAFRQSEGDQQDLIAGLRAARLDLALTYDLAIPADLAFEPLLRLPPYAVFDPAHPLAGRRAVTPADLAPHPMVLLDLPLSADYFLSLFQGVEPLITERTRDFSLARSMVANGFGYTLANIRPASDQAPDGGRLVYVPLEGAGPGLSLGLMLAQGAGRSATQAAFVDHARAELSR